MAPYEQTQPKPGHLSGKSVNPKRQPGMGDGTRASNAGKPGQDALSDNYPVEDSVNMTGRGSNAGMTEIPRGYVEVPAASQSTRKVSAKTIRKIKE